MDATLAPFVYTWYQFSHTYQAKIGKNRYAVNAELCMLMLNAKANVSLLTILLDFANHFSILILTNLRMH